MNKIFHIFVESCFWILLMLSKVLLVAFLFFVLSFWFNISNTIWIIVLFLSAIYGVYFAEKIRKKYGCSSYWSKIYSTPDIDGEN
jgi:hypothetical protein